MTEYLPISQKVHVEFVYAPETVEKVPAGQCVQVLLLYGLEYCPAEHQGYVHSVSFVNVHDCVTLGYAPEHVVHFVQLLLPPRLEKYPTAHSVHAEDPYDPENVPAGHASHAKPVSAASCAEYVPGSHAVHVSLDVAPSAVEYVPLWHAVQLPVPHV